MKRFALVLLGAAVSDGKKLPKNIQESIEGTMKKEEVGGNSFTWDKVYHLLAHDYDIWKDSITPSDFDKKITDAQTTAAIAQSKQHHEEF